MSTDLPHSALAEGAGEREDDAAYFQRRAVEELDLAQAATLPEAAAAHAALADAYLERMAAISPSTDHPDVDGERENG